MDALPSRLLEMGIVEGADVEMIRVSPLGGPILIKVRGCRLTIRKADAKMVEVSVTVRR
jgi:ferrous iron transport protein A